MKKIISVLLIAIMVASCFILASCGSTKSTKVKVVDIDLSSEEYAFCVSQSNTTLLASVNGLLKEMKADGTFDAICNKYFGDGTPTKKPSAKLDESKEQLVVATATGFEPFEMVDQNGNFYGIDLEIAFYIGEKLGLEVVIQDMEFSNVVTAVQTGKCTIGMAGLTVTPARSEIVTFTDSYYNAAQVVVCMADDTTFDDCKTADDVAKILASLGKDVKIGCQGGTTGELYINGDEDYGFDGLTATASPYTYVALAITAMTNGDVKYVIVDNGPAHAVTNKMNG